MQCGSCQGVDSDEVSHEETWAQKWSYSQATPLACLHVRSLVDPAENSPIVEGETPRFPSTPSHLLV
eukprot:m.193169 g.193169  ORF g.193169 m.193169 type:complete len:67 (+) comp24971_c0_seq1:3177-3377(+)